MDITFCVIANVAFIIMQNFFIELQCSEIVDNQLDNCNNFTL